MIIFVWSSNPSNMLFWLYALALPELRFKGKYIRYAIQGLERDLKAAARARLLVRNHISFIESAGFFFRHSFALLALLWTGDGGDADRMFCRRAHCHYTAGLPPLVQIAECSVPTSAGKYLAGATIFKVRMQVKIKSLFLFQLSNGTYVKKFSCMY